MIAYTTYNQLQGIFSEYNHSTHQKLEFRTVLISLYQSDNYLAAPPDLALTPSWNKLSNESFFQLLEQYPIPLSEIMGYDYSELLDENILIPEGDDISLTKYIYLVKTEIHAHDYFEIIYVMHGSATLQFEEGKRTLRLGELIVIAPQVNHNTWANTAESVIISLQIRKSTFHQTFFSNLASMNPLSMFFQKTLFGQTSDHYLLFHIGQRETTDNLIKCLFMEQYVHDEYSNINCVSHTKLLFSDIMRNFSDTIEYYSSEKISGYNLNIPLVLQYINNNYQTLSLSNLAEIFHYSEAHLSRLIKHYTNMTFSEYVTHLKMSLAVKYLERTSLKVSEISERLGYSSVDHFSRFFKKTYGVSPKSYQLAHRL